MRSRTLLLDLLQTGSTEAPSDAALQAWPRLRTLKLSSYSFQAPICALHRTSLVGA
jgi:hypothetical protein